MIQDKKYETERLILKPTTEDDASFIVELLNSPKWIKYIGDRKVKSIQDAKTYIQDKMIPQFKKLGYGNYTVIRKADNRKIGTCGLYDRDGLEGIDIGFAFLPEHDKMGYALEASLKIKNIALNEFGINEICAITTKDNISSQKLLEKLGLESSGSIKLPEDDKKLLVYSLKKSSSQ